MDVTMKALVKQFPEPGLTLLDIEKPEINSPDDILFKVEYCAICVGETKVYNWDEWAANDMTLKLPTVMGHEAAGVVLEVGAEVKQFKPGDRIVNDPLIYCGVCRQCREGFTNMCESREIYGKRRGAFAEYAVLPERVICQLNDRLTLEEGTVLENLGIAMHAVEIEAHDPGDWAVILGAGPIGILAAQILTAWGVNTVITDLSDARLAFAHQYTRAMVVDIKREDPVAKVLELTRGKGADFIIEMAANQKALDQAFEMVRIRGTIVTIGTFNNPVTFNPFFKMTRREIKLQSVMGRNWQTWRRMEQVIDAGQVDLKPLVSYVLPLEEYERGFELVKEHNVMKVLLKP
jgi:2-desacetyl-2-hydroxyethyl bacteriochlorophyllide A dehydrogenase